MLTTNERATRDLTSTLAPTGVALAADRPCVPLRNAVTPAAYQASTTASFADDLGTSIAGTTSFVASWSSIERKPMPKVALHPDRWPLHSTS